MKVVAFRDIGAFTQALEIIKELENRTDLETDDFITLKLMKSFCLKGMDKLEEGRKIFADYIKDRKESATKKFIKNHHKKIIQEENSKKSIEEDLKNTLSADKYIKKFMRNK
jgi:predicted RNA polymerase sigma factor